MILLSFYMQSNVVTIYGMEKIPLSFFKRTNTKQYYWLKNF